MKTAGVVLDTWKLPVFQQHLNNAGYQYTEHRGPAKDTVLLKVRYNRMSQVSLIIAAANRECAECKSKKIH